jgi:hypothetical protein
MKKVVFLSFVILLVALPAFARREESITLKLGEQKTTAIGKLKIRFVAIDSDSRCPVNARCIWAGNARVKITVSKARRSAKPFELNSTLDPNTVTYQGYDIHFVDLNPHPGEEKLEGAPPRKGFPKPTKRAAGLTLSISKHG